MELTKQQMEVVIFALDREIDLERMSEEDIDVDLHDMISYELFEVREAGKGEDIWN